MTCITEYFFCDYLWFCLSNNSEFLEDQPYIFSGKNPVGKHTCECSHTHTPPHTETYTQNTDSHIQIYRKTICIFWVLHGHYQMTDNELLQKESKEGGGKETLIFILTFSSILTFSWESQFLASQILPLQSGWIRLNMFSKHFPELIFYGSFEMFVVIKRDNIIEYSCWGSTWCNQMLRK